MSHVQRRRGKPNRGGGRGNRGGGSRGGRGGRGGKSGQSGPRKVGAHALADEDFSLDAPDDEPPPTYHHGSSRGSNSRRKVTMQRLHMSAENQNIVRDMLQQLHIGAEEDYEDSEAVGRGFEEIEGDEYDELDIRMENQYWLTNNQIQVENVVDNSVFAALRQDHEKTPVEATTSTYSKIAINKLLRYGFDTKRCEEALADNDGDIGSSLIALLTQCFNIVSKSDCDEDKTGAFWEDIAEQRNEEMTALSSIYGDDFKERVAGKVWILSLEMEHLTELASKIMSETLPHNKHKKSIDKIRANRSDVCRYFLKGTCKFGTRCRLKHLTREELEVQCNTSYKDYVDSDVSHMYELEIRFPESNTYPLEPPLIAFSSTNTLLPKHVCLNITARLMREAKDLAESQLPVIFSLMGVLDDNAEIDEIFKLPPTSFSLPAPLIKRHQQQTKTDATPQIVQQSELSLNGNDSVSAAHLKVGKGSVSEGKQPSRKQTDHKRHTKRDGLSKQSKLPEILKNNSKLKEKFGRIQNSDSYQKMQNERHKLPAWNESERILTTLTDAQVLVISGMTGCGKTTQVPQFILDDWLNSPGEQVCNIVCTQPRRISAIGVADRVAKERAEKLGGIVGYQIRMENLQSSSTRLLFCTTGILLRKLQGDSTLADITHIIIDEVHERTEESDFLMLIIRDLLPYRPDLKLILMSATLNANLFSHYFFDCPVVEIPGRTFPVDQYFLEDAIEFTGFQMDERSPYARPLKLANASRNEKFKFKSKKTIDDVQEDINEALEGEAAPPKVSLHDQHLTPAQLSRRFPNCSKSTLASMALMDHEKVNNDLIESLLEWIVTGDHKYPKDGAILVFLPGFAEISNLFEQLSNSSLFGKRNWKKYKIIPLHSTLSSEEQQAVFNKPKVGVTKIVLATNIAETSITIDDVVYVIDGGRMKEKRYDASKGMESLDTVWVSRANALQRKGRAGRVAAGVAFHLFTSHRFDYHLCDHQLPEIQRIPLEQLILKIKLLEIFKGLQVQEVLSGLLEAPSVMAVTTSLRRLQDLGALDDLKNLTALGYHLAFLPVDVRIGKLMLFGAIFRCLDPALTIAATLSFKSPFVAPFSKRDEADKKKLEFAVGNSDHLTMLRAYQGWISAGKQGGRAAYVFCQENYLSIKTLEMLASMKRQFAELLSDIGFLSSELTTRSIERLARDGSDGVLPATGSEANANSENMKLVAAILVAALYPNVVQVMTPESKYSMTGAGAVPKAPKAEEIKFKTKMDGYVHIHPSSINFQVRHYESPYLVFHEKIKTSKVYLRDCTMVSVYPLLLFGGGSISVDLNRGEFIMSVDDGWIRFILSSNQIGELLKELRLELDLLLSDKIENPQMDLCTCPRGSKIIQTIVRLITTQ